ncbi:MAG: 4Fe-4S binding protein [Candidatus Marithrix sp.]
MIIHPGLPVIWGMLVGIILLLISIWAIWKPISTYTTTSHYSLSKLPIIGQLIRQITITPWLLFFVKVIVVALFLLIIAAGLFGTPIADRNIATMLTWNIWWSGLIIAVFFLGSAWCAVCPWDTLANWLVHRRLWKRSASYTSLNLPVPKPFRNVLPALLLFIILTWLELGVTISPYTTALLALLMIILATISLAIFERKAFCRYFCPVGRTIGFYAQLAPIELRPINNNICIKCNSLECYYGSTTVDGCPTNLVMGRLTQNTYCTNCGNCSRSCPVQNVAWQLRPPSTEAIQTARPHWDEAWFMLGLMALTAFHGLTMMAFWETWMGELTIGGSGLWSFSIVLIVSLLLPLPPYISALGLTKRFTNSELSIKQLFPQFAFIAIPLAFAYHLAHNLNHLIRESVGASSVFANPFGTGTLPLSLIEKQAKYTEILLPVELLFFLQASLLIFGFLIAVYVIRQRGRALLTGNPWQLSPMVLFAILITGYHLWLLMEPMVIRVSGVCLPVSI